ncbi:P63C domain-containing protein [Sulfurospirillum diekertiae]|uniref:P63C domain-containing protein n=1 Tax=Sulfurospirillum diekertiae TaxID=1854492 RepID=UPI000B4CDD22|nr:P63C domain-containing protein [Sulfurospirillum diekertiae]ASC92440.1 hypothetical protein Sdiek2_0403 [Sulfurospirillum diekertiae]
MENQYPKAIVSAPLKIGDTELLCAVLDDEKNTRIISASAVFGAFERPRKGQNKRLEIDSFLVPPFLAAKNLEPYMNQDLLKILQQVEYLDGTKKVKGYDARILPKICSLYLEARRDKNVLTSSQEKFAIRAEILQSAFSEVGIVALVDEATGFQHSRKYDALRLLLEQYINDGIQKWVKRFPDEFFLLLDKIYVNPATSSRNRPKYYGKFINKYIYEPIERGYLKSKLDELNINDDKTRKARFHQWLTDFGASQLTLQLGKVMSMLEFSPNLDKFKENIRRQQGLTIQPKLFEDL